MFRLKVAKGKRKEMRQEVITIIYAKDEGVWIKVITVEVMRSGPIPIMI